MLASAAMPRIIEISATGQRAVTGNEMAWPATSEPADDDYYFSVAALADGGYKAQRR